MRTRIQDLQYSSAEAIKEALLTFIGEQKEFFNKNHKIYSALLDCENNLKNNHSIVYACHTLSAAIGDSAEPGKNIKNTVDWLITKSETLDSDLYLYLQGDKDQAAINAQVLSSQYRKAYGEFSLKTEDITPEIMRATIAGMLAAYIEVVEANKEFGQEVEPEHQAQLMKKLCQFQADMLASRCKLESINSLVLPGDEKSEEYIQTQLILDNFFTVVVVSDPELADKAREADNCRIDLLRAVDYFSKERLINPVIPEDPRELKAFEQAVEQLLKFLIQYKKYKREVKGEHFDCLYFKVFPMLSQEEIEQARAKKNNTNSKKIEGELELCMRTHEKDLKKIEDTINERIRQLQKSTSAKEDRFQIIINNGSHCTAVDVLLARDARGDIQKKCFILDAAQEPRMLETMTIFTKLKFIKYIAGVEGETIQHDTFSCPIFATVLLGKSSSDPKLFDHLEDIRKLPKRAKGVTDTKEEHVIAWQELPARYIKYAQSERFLADYTKNMPAEVKEMPVNKKGQSLKKYLAGKTRMVTYPSTSALSFLFPKVEEKPQNIATTHKILAYANDVLDVVHSNTAFALLNMAQGKKDDSFKVAKNIKLEYNPKEFDRDFTKSTKKP